MTRRAFYPHGSAMRYDHGSENDPPCREKCCREAKNAERRRRSRLRAYGRPTMTAAGPVAGHVETLRAAGMGTRQIALRAGVSKDTVARLHQQKQVQVRVATKLLAVRPGEDDIPHEQGCYVPAVGTQRRLHALLAVGWTLTAVAEEADVNRHIIQAISLGRRTTIRVMTARRVREATARMWERQPPWRTAPERRRITSSLRLAAKYSAVPLAAWDDIDDPAASPIVDLPVDRQDGDPHVVDAFLAERVIWAQLNTADRHLLARWCRRQGWTRSEIAARAHTTAAALDHYMTQAREAA